MKKAFICKSKLEIDIDSCVKEFLDGNYASIEEYILDFWEGLDDCYYACDNEFEIRLEIRNLMRQAIAGGNK